MKTLVTDQSFRFGQENIIPYAGKVKISETGTIEVEDSIAQKVVDSDCGFYFYQGESIDQTTTTTTIEQTTTTTTVEQTTTTTTVEQATTTTTTELIGNPEDQELGKTQDDELGSKEGDDDLSKSSDDVTTTTTELEQVVENTTLAQEGNFDVEAAKASLKDNTLAELKEMAKDFPSAEWRTLNKEDLINYIVSKIQ